MIDSQVPHLEDDEQEQQEHGEWTVLIISCKFASATQNLILFIHRQIISRRVSTLEGCVEMKAHGSKYNETSALTFSE